VPARFTSLVVIGMTVARIGKLARRGS
jgi:hypothetical protein